MKTYFKSKKCPHQDCEGMMDPTFDTCPFCHRQVEVPASSPFFHHIKLFWGKQLALYGVGWLGLQILGLLIGVIMAAYLIANGRGDTGMTPQEYMVTEAVIYLVILAALLVMCGLFKVLIPIFASFKQWKSILFGLVGFVAILGAEYVYNIFINILFQAAGFNPPGDNANQTLIIQLTLAMPVSAFIIFGLVGPFCEEVTYRIGLFGFLSRLGKPLGYLLTGLVFGFIHFDFTAIVDGAQFVVEIVNLPSYIGAGVALAFLYDRLGFAASFTAHAMNNIYSVVMILVSQNLQQ